MRYPGSRPFQDNDVDRVIFFGRDSEKSALFHLILAEDLVLLYAKSGMGKTSLLNAGVFQQLREKEYWPFVLRFNQPGTDVIAGIQQQIRSQAARDRLEVQSAREIYVHLWLFFHDLKLWQKDVLFTPVLIFDQFEELFTVTDVNQSRAFVTQFASLARQTFPVDELETFTSEKSVQKPPALKMVVSMREDYLGEIEAVAAEAPQVMHNRFRLTALTRAQARCAIEAPADLEGDGIPGRRFRYDPQAIEEMLDFLCERRNRSGVVKGDEVEPFQLQILCQHMEDQIAWNEEPAGGVQAVTAAELGGRQGMESILQQFYNKQIENMPTEDRAAVRRLCERGLISETEKRLSLEEDEIKRVFGIGKALLEKLVELRLLRAEPRVGSFYYELSHDTLVAPILRDRKERDPEAIYRCAEQLVLQGTNDSAIGAYQRVIQLNPQHALAYLELGKLFKQLNRLDRALNTLNEGVQRGVEDVSVYHLLGEVLAQRGDYKKAIVNYEKALKMNSGAAYIHADLAESYALDNQADKAIPAYERALEIEKSPDTFKQLALLYIRKGDSEKAVEIFKQVIVENPRDAYIFKDLVAELKVRKATAQALEICHAALNVPAESDTLFFRVGYELGEMKDFEHAILACEKSASLNPEEPNTFNNWGIYLSKLGHFEEALGKFRAAVAANPEAAFAYINWADTLWDSGRRDEALDVSRQAIAAVPKSAEVHTSFGWRLYHFGRYDEALQQYQASMEINPKLASTHACWGALLARLGQKEAARERLESAEAYAREVGEMAILGWSYYLIEDYRKSVHWSRKASEKEESTAVHENLGLALLHSGERQKAERVYAKAIQMALEQNKISELNAGIVDLKEALERNPQLSGGWEMLGLLQSAANGQAVPTPAQATATA
jgi:tetratricopeptide (TPR) repeat protein